MTLEPGRIVGKYEVLERIGSGAMASVYKARHLQLDAVVALKVLDGAPGRMQDRLLMEGRVQAKLRHPNVVSVTDVLEVDGAPALVMELVPGPNLAQHILLHHPLPLPAIDGLAVGILKGVRAAHQAGHLHRDLKPANILLQPLDGEMIPKIADFGLVKLLGDPESPTQTRTGQLLGSPAYMSPEQTMSALHLDQRTDVWALGTVLYQLVTGRLAFPQRDLVTVFSLVRSGEFRDPRDLRPGIPDRMWRAILGSMTVDVRTRIPDCNTLLEVWEGKRTFEPPSVESADTLVMDMFSAEVPREPPPQPPVPTDLPRSEPVTPPAPAASTSPWLTRGAVMAAILLASITLGLTTRPSTREPVPAPAPDPAAPDPDPMPVPVPVPVPEPVPEPAPAPSPAPVPSLAVPLPAPPQSPDPTPEPAPAPTAAMGTFVATGQAEQVWLVGQGRYFEPGPVPVGAYTVSARFPGRPQGPVEGVRVEVPADGVVTVDCIAGFLTCRVR